MALPGSLLDIDEFAARTIAPASIVYGDWIDPSGSFTDPIKAAKREAHQTFVRSRLVIETSRLYARLRKRYAIPFVAPFPEIACGWLEAVVTPSVYRRRGIDPTDEQIVSLDALAAKALEEQKEAADSKDGLYELPLRQDLPSTGVDHGGPLGYAEADPYEWRDRQREILVGGGC